MANRFRIADWSKHFETPESRKRKGPLGWVAIPTRMDGANYRRLMNRQDRMALMGAWVLILEVAAKCPTRGVLTDSNGKSLTAEDLALKTGGDEPTFQAALEFFSSPKICWILTDDDGFPSDAIRSDGNRLRQYRTEQYSTAAAEGPKGAVMRRSPERGGDPAVPPAAAAVDTTDAAERRRRALAEIGVNEPALSRLAAAPELKASEIRERASQIQTNRGGVGAVVTVLDGLVDERRNGRRKGT